MTKLFTRLRELEAKANNGESGSMSDFIAEARNSIQKLIQVIDLYEEALLRYKEIEKAQEEAISEAMKNHPPKTGTEAVIMSHVWTHARQALEKARAIADGEEIAGDE